MIDDYIYEIDSADTSQEGGKKIKSGATVMIPAGTMLGKSGKASTNGALTKKEEEEGDGKKKGGDKGKRKKLFERYLKTTRTDEQQHNIEELQLHRQLYSTFTGEKKWQRDIGYVEIISSTIFPIASFVFDSWALKIRVKIFSLFYKCYKK